MSLGRQRHGRVRRCGGPAHHALRENGGQSCFVGSLEHAVALPNEGLESRSRDAASETRGPHESRIPPAWPPRCVQTSTLQRFPGSFCPPSSRLGVLFISSAARLTSRDASGSVACWPVVSHPPVGFVSPLLDPQTAGAVRPREGGGPCTIFSPFSQSPVQRRSPHLHPRTGISSRLKCPRVIGHLSALLPACAAPGGRAVACRRGLCRPRRCALRLGVARPCS